MKKILITGAFGFVGSNLAAYLAERGFELWALDVEDSARVRECESAKVEKERVSAYSRTYTWEQLDELPWGEVYAVIHLAGKAHDTKNTTDAQSYFDINTGLTQRIVSSLVRYCASALVEDSKTDDLSKKGSNAGNRESAIGSYKTNQLIDARTHAFRKFILFSSVKAVADRVDGVLTEDAQADPQTPYGQSKLAAERILRPQSGLKDECKKGDCDHGASYAKATVPMVVAMKRVKGRLQPAGGSTGEGQRGSGFLHSALQPLGGCKMRTYVLRPCMIHGPGNKGNLNLLYNVVRKGIPWPLGAYDNERSFASIANVCAVVESLIREDVPSGTFQVADDETLSTNELIGLMAESLGKRARIWGIPRGLIAGVARIGDVLRLPLNSERLKKLTESYVVSNAKIKQALGWDHMPVSAKEGMLRTLRSFLGML